MTPVSLKQNVPSWLRAIPCYRHYIQRPVFLETNFLNKLILHSFQCIICTNIPHRVHDHQQKRNFPFFHKGFQNFCVKLCYEHYKKINLQFFVFTWHFFPLWIDLDLDLDNLEVRFELELKTSFCGHYTIFVTDIALWNFFFTLVRKGIVLFI